MIRFRACASILFAGAVACSSGPRPEAEPPPEAAPEAGGIILERTLCYGTCPAYWLSVNSSGHVQFQSRNPGEEGTVFFDTIPAHGYRHLGTMAERTGFFLLPETIDEETTDYCADYATDHPTVTVTVFDDRRRKSVRYYTGCYSGVGEHTVVEPIGRLRRFIAAIDSVSGSSRWVRPSAFQR
jgi:hypothetical protein